MKKTITLMWSILIGITSFAQNQTQDDNSSRTKVLKEIASRSTAIFEGKILSKNKSFWGVGENIYTSFTIDVAEVLFGDIAKGTIEIIVPGGQLEKDGIVYDQDIHGLACSGYSTFFCTPSALSSGIKHTNNTPLSIVDNICYNSKGEIPPPSSSGGDVDPYFKPFKNINDLYIELNKIKPIAIPKEKKVQM